MTKNKSKVIQMTTDKRKSEDWSTLKKILFWIYDIVCIPGAITVMITLVISRNWFKEPPLLFSRNPVFFRSISGNFAFMFYYYLFF